MVGLGGTAAEAAAKAAGAETTDAMVVAGTVVGVEAEIDGEVGAYAAGMRVVGAVAAEGVGAYAAEGLLVGARAAIEAEAVNERAAAAEVLVVVVVAVGAMAETEGVGVGCFKLKSIKTVDGVLIGLKMKLSRYGRPWAGQTPPTVGLGQPRHV